MDERPAPYAPRRNWNPSRPHGYNLLGLAIVLAVLIILLVHVTILPIYEVVPGRSFMRRRILGDYEPSLCSTNFKPFQNVRFRRVCPRDGIVTVTQGGRLGKFLIKHL